MARDICYGLSKGCGVPFPLQMELLKKIGFDGFFLVWEPNLDMDALTAKAESLGLYFQSIHAPWDHAADMWHENEEKAQQGITQLTTCVDVCVSCGAPILVIHAFMGFDEHEPNDLGIARFKQVVDYARGRNIRIAFENTEGEEYLQALMEAFAADGHVGFCWDSGHELCYNRSKDLLALYGDRLLVTHLNDNLGICDPAGKITWLDDLHLLPFDGMANWEDVAVRLRRTGYSGALTFELNIKSKPGRNENDRYGAMPYEEYLAEVYRRACRIRDMLDVPNG
jgi:sugar phosphate isomerase/epimerase